MVIEKIENKEKEIVGKFIEAHRRAMHNPHMRFAVYLNVKDDYEPYIFEDIAGGNSMPSAAFDDGDVYFGEYCEQDLLDVFDSGEDFIKCFKDYGLNEEQEEQFDTWLKKKWKEYEECVNEDYGDETPEYNDFLDECLNHSMYKEKFNLEAFNEECYKVFIDCIVEDIISNNESERFYENQFEYRLNDLM